MTSINLDHEVVTLFGQSLCLVINDLINSDFRRSKNLGAPFSFSENHLRKQFTTNIAKLNDKKNGLILEFEKHICDDYKSSNKNHGGTDYFYVHELSDCYSSSMVISTFEVKGPTRPSLLKGSKKNWYPKIVKDVEKQVWRNKNFSSNLNYIVLLFTPLNNFDTHTLAQSFYKTVEEEVGNVKLIERYWNRVDFSSSTLFISIVLVNCND